MAKKQVYTQEEADAAYARAQQMIAEAKESGEDELDFESLGALQILPAEVAQLTELEALHVGYSEVSDLAPIARLTGIRHLFLGESKITDIATIGELANLETLSAHELGIQDFSALEKFEGLRHLSLDGCSIVSLEPLRKLKQLDELFLGYTEIRSLEALSDLNELSILGVQNTSIVDLEGLGGKSSLRELYLSHTKVKNLSQIAGCDELRILDLDNTLVSDIKPLANLPKLEFLDLEGTPLEELSAVSKIKELAGLNLSGTLIDNIDALVNLTNLCTLYIEDSLVRDLRPLLSLPQLFDAEELNDERNYLGVFFKNCEATRSDPKLKEISEIRDHKDRNAQLWDYLQTLHPIEAEAVPDPQAAPIQVTRSGNLLLRGPALDLPDDPVQGRAQKGWQAIKTLRTTVGVGMQLGNYPQLNALLAALDTALGDTYDPDQAVLIGSLGSALYSLCDNAEYARELPSGAAPVFVEFAMQVQVYVNRFPDWDSYQGDQITHISDAADDLADYRDITSDMQDSEHADPDLVRAVNQLLDVLEELPGNLEISKGTLATVRELAREMAEAIFENGSVKQYAERKRDAILSVHEQETAKVLWYLGGFAYAAFLRRGPQWYRLAEKHPAQLGWLIPVLKKIGAKRDP